MEQKKLFPPTLSVAGEFKAADGQIGLPTTFHGRAQQSLENALMPLQDVCIRPGDAAELRPYEPRS